MEATFKRILLVEDDEKLRMMLADTLEAAGYRVGHASTGEEGIRVAREFDPTVIVCDVQMPRGDGRSVLAALRDDKRLGTAQFVFMTGDVHATPQREGMNLGADDYLEKPFSSADFLACVAARCERAEILRKADERALNRLSATVSKELPHELFTPLTGIIGLAEVLLEEGEELDPKVAKEMIAGIRASGDRLNRTLRNYLTILEFINNRPIAPDPEARLDPEMVRVVTSEAAMSVAQKNRREADVRVEGEGFVLVGSRNNLAAVVVELVDNACKFSDPGTPVVVRLSRDDEHLRLEVSDRGRGMSAEQVSQIGAFRQFDRNKYEQQGLGLGLTLTQHLVERDGGTVKITSAPATGTVAVATWPVTREPA
jgi:two-component system sensor histidine kinase/response regulator